MCVFSFLLCANISNSALEGKANQVTEPAITYADDVNVDPENFWPDPELKKVFKEYWRLRFSGKADKAFLMEAPYFQEMVNFNKYKGFVKENPNHLTEMKMREHDQRTQRLHLLHYTARLEDSNGVIRDYNLLDQWIFYNDQWYHVWRDRLIFQGAS